MMAAVFVLAAFWAEGFTTAGFREMLLWIDDRGFAFAMKE
jgi:hypothetical protein